MKTAKQLEPPVVAHVIFIHPRGATRIDLTTPRTVEEIYKQVRRAIVTHGRDASQVIVSLPDGSDTVVVNL